MGNLHVIDKYGFHCNKNKCVLYSHCYIEQSLPFSLLFFMVKFKTTKCKSTGENKGFVIVGQVLVPAQYKKM